MPPALPDPLPHSDAAPFSRDGDAMAESRLRRLAGAGIVGILRADFAGRVLDANAAFLAMVGYTRGDLAAGLRWDVMTPPEWRGVDEQIVRALDATGEAQPVEKEYVHKDGRRVPVLVGAALLSRETTETIAFVVDLTRQRAAEGARAASRAQLQTVLDAAPTVVYAKDLEGRYTLVNAAFERLLGLPRTEIFGRTDHDLFPADRADAFVANDAEVLRRGDTLVAEENAPGPDGRLRTYVSAKFPLRGAAGGGVAGVAGISTDVTAEHEAERARQESEARLALALDAAELGTFYWDVVAGAHVWDERLYGLYGLAPGTPVTDALVLACVHPDDRARVVADGARALDPSAEAPGGAPPVRGAGERRYAMRYRIVRPRAGRPAHEDAPSTDAAAPVGRGEGGAVRHVAVLARVTFAADAQGTSGAAGGASVGTDVVLRAVRVSGTVQDVTAQAEAEEALAARAADQAFLLDLVARLALLADPAAIGRAAARALGERLGLSRCFFAEVDLVRDVYDIRGMEYDDGVHPPPAGAGPGGRLRRAPARGRARRARHRGGRYRVRRAHGALPHGRLRTATRGRVRAPPTAPGWPLGRGPAARHGRATRVGRRRSGARARGGRARLGGRRHGAARGGGAHRAEEAEAAALQLQEQAAELEAANEELHAVAAELEERTEVAERARAAADRARDEAEAAHVQAQSAYAEAEQQRADAERHRAESERANRARADFLASMSHELRTPLNAIQGYVQLVEDGIYGPVTDGQRHALGRVGRAQAHLLGLVTDVLNFTRLEEGRVTFDVREVAVADVVRDVVPLVAPQLAAKGLALDVALPDASLLVWADQEKLGQVLLNLLANAVKFTPAVQADGTPGRVRVTLTSRAETPEMAYLRVHDTGIGIARDKQDAVFEPFVQVSTGLTRTTEGTGLGLAISRDLARGMGGDLRVRSAPGAGSAFTVALRRVVAVDGTPVDRRIRDERRVREDRRTLADRRREADDRARD
jgi:PAS domain S-box-containing protein